MRFSSYRSNRHSRSLRRYIARAAHGTPTHSSTAQNRTSLTFNVRATRHVASRPCRPQSVRFQHFRLIFSFFILGPVLLPLHLDDDDGGPRISPDNGSSPSPEPGLRARERGRDQNICKKKQHAGTRAFRYQVPSPGHEYGQFSHGLLQIFSSGIALLFCLVVMHCVPVIMFCGCQFRRKSERIASN
jgi:hypothetical protein